MMPEKLVPEIRRTNLGWIKEVAKPEEIAKLLYDVWVEGVCTLSNSRSAVNVKDFEEWLREAR